MPSTPLIRFKKEQQQKKEEATKKTGALVQGGGGGLDEVGSRGWFDATLTGVAEKQEEKEWYSLRALSLVAREKPTHNQIDRPNVSVDR